MRNKKSVRKAVTIQVYFGQDAHSEKMVNRIEKLSEVTGLSISSVAGMAIRSGISKLEKTLGADLSDKKSK